MSGPTFLVVYAILAIAANVGLRRFLSWRESGRSARLLEFARDPYRIAYLRGGAVEAIRLATFSLVDRGLLVEVDSKVQWARDDAADHVRRPIEKAVLDYSRYPVALDSLENFGGLRSAVDGYEADLEQMGLFAGEQVRAQRFLPFAAMLALLLGVAALRIQYAVNHGHYNIGFLIALAAIGGFSLNTARKRRETGLSDIAFERLQALFVRLLRDMDRLTPGGHSNEAVLTAAVFGAGALPADRFSLIQRLFPKPVRNNGGSDGGSTSSSGGCGGCGG